MGAPGGRAADPFVVPPGYGQAIVAEESDPLANAAGTSEDLWDMSTQNESGKDAGRYVYRAHEVGPASGDPRTTAGGAGVTVTDLKTGKTRLIAERSDWERFDGIVWTPWGTILAAEEVSARAARGVEETWRRSIAEALAVIDLLDARIAPLHEELRPFAAADPRVLLLRTVPGIGELLGLTFAAEIGDVARFSSPRKLIGYAGLAPRISQSGERSRTGALSKAGSRTLRWAAVEAAHQARRPSNPWHELYTELAKRNGKNPAKSAVARKVLIAAWHVLSRDQPFKPSRPRGGTPVSASSRCFLAA